VNGKGTGKTLPRRASGRLPGQCTVRRRCPKIKPPAAGELKAIDDRVREEVQRRLREKAVEEGKDKKPYLVHNLYCHICHYRRDTGIHFPCVNHKHVYCERHVVSRMDFKLGESLEAVTYCRICALECTCSSCKKALDVESVKLMRAEEEWNFCKKVTPDVKLEETESMTAQACVSMDPVKSSVAVPPGDNNLLVPLTSNVLNNDNCLVDDVTSSTLVRKPCRKRKRSLAAKEGEMNAYLMEFPDAQLEPVLKDPCALQIKEKKKPRCKAKAKTPKQPKPRKLSKKSKSDINDAVNNGIYNEK